MTQRLMTGRTDERGRVAVYFWEEYLGNAPSIINAVRLLSAAGYGVDIITRHNPVFPRPPSFPTNVRVFMQGESSSQDGQRSERATQPERRVGLASTIRQRARGIVRGLVRGAIKRITPTSNTPHYYDLRGVLRFVAFCIRQTRSQHYVCVIGVDTLGLAVATIMNLHRKTPIIYWSLEIRYARELTHVLDRLLKTLERPCNRRAALTIIQDSERSNSLRVENAIDPSKILIVPNGPLGQRPRFGSDLLRRKFGLRQHDRIILHIGRIEPQVLSRELAAAASHWPEDWVLIFHGGIRWYDEVYLEEVREAGKGRALQSLEPLSYDELDMLVMSGDIGIVVYQKELGPNHALAGSSGKLGHYLRCGLPVVSLDLPGLPEVLHRYQCGICVSDLEGMAGAIERILQRYDFYSANAVKCYEEVYEFGRHFGQVLRHIERLTTASLAEKGPDRAGDVL